MSIGMSIVTVTVTATVIATRGNGTEMVIATVTATEIIEATVTRTMLKNVPQHATIVVITFRFSWLPRLLAVQLIVYSCGCHLHAVSLNT